MSFWGSVAQWASVVATLAAVLVALFKDQIISWLRKPKLVVSARQTPPDIDKIPIVYQTLLNPVLSSVDCYFLRLWVENKGNVRAEKIQVFVARLLRQVANGTFSPVDSFLPMNLRWGESSTGAEVFAESISPGMGRHCNLAHVTDPAKRSLIGENHPDVEKEQTVLLLETELRPTNGCHLHPPGTYRLELQVAAANCRPTPYTVEITVTGKWYTDKERMFRDGLVMRLVA